MVGKLTPDTEMSCSRLPALMGFSPYSTPNDELAKTVDALAGKPAPEWKGSEPADWGNRLEPMILEQVGDRLGLELLHFPTTPYAAPDGIALNASLDGVGQMIHKDGMWIESDPDRGIYVIGATKVRLDGPGVLESKLTNSKPEDEPAPHRGPIQLQGCMLCTGYTWGAIGVLYGGTELRIFLYQRDERVINEIIKLVADFEKRKHGPDWYPPLSTADAARTWKTAEEGEPAIKLSTDVIDLIDDVLTAKEVIKAAEATIDAASTAIMEMMGNHVEGLAEDADGTVYRVRWPMRNYKAQPEKVTPAKAAYSVRQKTLDIKVVS